MLLFLITLAAADRLDAVGYIGCALKGKKTRKRKKEKKKGY